VANSDRGDFKRDLTRHWDRGALTYDAIPGHGLIHDDEYRAWRRTLAAILGDPAHADVPRLRVLDVGTGTGSMALLAAELGHDVTGVDLSEKMLDQARAKAGSSGLGVSWQIGDAEALPTDLRGFDVVLNRHLLWTLPDPGRAIEAWSDALVPGGLVAVIDGVIRKRPTAARVAARIAEALLRVLPSTDAPTDHAYPHDAFRQLPLARRPDTSAAVDLARGAGLENVRVRWLPEVDRVERAHRNTLEQLANPWRRYLLTGRTRIVTAGSE
jgi:ubiquinone/menaquinone biosynthesis C-methylase UbiE